MTAKLGLAFGVGVGARRHHPGFAGALAGLLPNIPTVDPPIARSAAPMPPGTMTQPRFDGSA
jgi:hypothetical protein